MRILRALRPSLRGLLVHRTRSLLAAAGVAMGIAAVFLTSAIGQGAQAEMLKNLGTTGTRLLVVRPEQVKRTVARKELQGFMTSLKFEDYQAIRKLPKVEAAAPSIEGLRKIKANQGTVTTTVFGTTNAFFQIRDFRVERGRLFNEEEETELSRSAVLGAQISDSLFPGEEPVGREVRIGGMAFEVVGTLARKGVAADGSDADNQVFIPARTAERRVFNARCLNAVFVGVHRSEDLDPLETEIRALLRERHALAQRNRTDDFAVQNQLRFLSAQRQTMRPLQLVTTGLAVISLFVGATGILGLMLLSVKERTPEIGLRMAVGARPRDILFQFLAEAVVLSLSGGTMGVVLGMLGTRGLAAVTRWPMAVSVQTPMVALAVSAAIGMVAGAFPARKASLLPPIRALAQE